MQGAHAGRGHTGRWLLVSCALACACACTQSGTAVQAESAYRLIPDSRACLPCNLSRYVVIDSPEAVERLHEELKQTCSGPHLPEAWIRSIEDLQIDFRKEAIVTLYEVIGTGGKPSLRVRGPEDGVLEAAIAWSVGPGPQVPIATAACLVFAANKALVRRVDFIIGGLPDQADVKLSQSIQGASERRPGQ